MKGSFRNSCCLSSSSWTQLSRQHARFLLDPTLDVSCPAPTLFCALDYQRYLHIFALDHSITKNIVIFSTSHHSIAFSWRLLGHLPYFRSPLMAHEKYLFSTRNFFWGAAYRLVLARSLASCVARFSLVLIYFLSWINYYHFFSMSVSMIIIFSRSWSSWRRSRVGRWYWPPSRLHIIPTPSMLSLSMIFYLTEVNIHIIHIIPAPSMLSLSIIFLRNRSTFTLFTLSQCLSQCCPFK